MISVAFLKSAMTAIRTRSERFPPRSRSEAVSLSAEQWKLVVDHLDWASKRAAIEHNRLNNPAIDLDLCRAEAQYGLIDAARKYEARNEASFKTYARTVIKWRILELVTGKHAPGRFVSLTEEVEEDILKANPDFSRGNLAGFVAGATRRKARQPAYSDKEEQIWQAWTPQMRFSAVREAPRYAALRTEVSKLTSKGCGLALLLSKANLYALLGAPLAQRQSRTSLPKTSLQKRVAHIRTTRDATVRKAQELAEAVRNLQNAVEQFRLDLPEIDSVLPHFLDLPQALDRYAEGMRATQLPANTPADLVTWRRRQLVELVSHVKEHNVKHLWKPLAYLVSCWNHGGIDVDYSPEPPHLLLKESQPRFSKTARKLRLEYNHGVKELEDPGRSPQKRSTF